MKVFLDLGHVKTEVDDKLVIFTHNDNLRTYSIYLDEPNKKVYLLREFMRDIVSYDSFDFSFWGNKFTTEAIVKAMQTSLEYLMIRPDAFGNLTVENVRRFLMLAAKEFEI